MKMAALIGTTASGKSDIAHEIAQRHHALLFSLDSLSIYKFIDIASAKPSQRERAQFTYYGLDLFEPDEAFNITQLIDAYHAARALAKKENRALLFVGGSSFYLKSFIDGLSSLPTFSDTVIAQCETMLEDGTAFTFLQDVDPLYASKIEAADHFRLRKALRINLQTNMSMQDYFHANPPQKIIQEPLKIFNLTMEKAQNRRRIEARTEAMFQNGLVEEVQWLRSHYAASSQSMRAIGIKEIVTCLDGAISLDDAKTQIINHTAQLAKRQRTFNAHQFASVISGDAAHLMQQLNAHFS